MAQKRNPYDDFGEVVEDDYSQFGDVVDFDSFGSVVEEPEPVITAPDPLVAAKEFLDNTPKVEAPVAPVVEPEPTLWERVSKPLTDLPSRFARSVADVIDAPSENPIIPPTVKGFLAGATEGLGNVLTEATSPINLAGMLTGTRGAGTIAKGLRGIGKAADLGVAAHGAEEIVQGDPAIGVTELLAGSAGVLPSKVANTRFGAPAKIAEEVVPPVVKDVEVPITPVIEELPTLYHGTRSNIEQAFDVTKNKPGSNFADHISMTENPEYSGLYSIGEGLGQKRYLPEGIIGANTIAIKASPQSILDLTQPLTPETFNILKQAYFAKNPKGHLENFDNWSLEQKASALRGLDLPFDAIKYTEHGQTNWAMKPNVSMKTPGGLSLNKPEIVPQTGKPRIKLKANADGSWNMDDPQTAAIVNAMKNKQPVPQAERISPAEEVTVPEQLTAIPKTPPADAPPEIKEGWSAFREKLSNEFFNFNKAVQSSYDLSFPFRQGRGAVLHKGWWNSWKEMFKAGWDENNMKALKASIEERPLFTPDEKGRSFAKEAGLAIYDKEDALGNSALAEKLYPGIRASNRAYNAFALKLRSDMFESAINDARRIYETAKATGYTSRLPFEWGINVPGLRKQVGDVELLNPDTNMVLASELAKAINSVTGRGDTKKLGLHAGRIKDLLFSPGLIASRLEHMNPRNYVYANPQVRKMYLKSILGLAGTWNLMNQYYKLSQDAEVNTDPTNSDFGKARIGDFRADPGAGFQQYLVLASRLADGTYTSPVSGRNVQYGSKFGVRTRSDALIDFIASKLAPLPSYAFRAANASSSRPFNLQDETLRLFIPMIAQDIDEMVQQDPWLIPGTLPLTLTGAAGTQSFNKDPQKQMIPSQMFQEMTGFEDINANDLRLPIRRSLGIR